MIEIFGNWEWWQIALTVVFGTLWAVFFILDCRRKSKLKKILNQKAHELKAQGYSDNVIKEMLQHRTRDLFIKDGEK